MPYLFNYPIQRLTPPFPPYNLHACHLGLEAVLREIRNWIRLCFFGCTSRIQNFKISPQGDFEKKRLFQVQGWDWGNHFRVAKIGGIFSFWALEVPRMDGPTWVGALNPLSHHSKVWNVLSCLPFKQCDCSSCPLCFFLQILTISFSTNCSSVVTKAQIR